MTEFVFAPRPQPDLAVRGTSQTYPVARIFCVGRNYAAHAAEMGSEVDREKPFYFTKAAHHLLPSGGDFGFPPGTADLHHEVELVVAIGQPAFRISPAGAMDAVFGYAVGLDMTRRDLQAEAKDKRRPWDTGKDFEGSAVIAALTPASALGSIGQLQIKLSVNDIVRQDAVLSDMVWGVADIISHLSTLYHLDAGDLIMTGTPAGVGAVAPGDRLTGSIDGLEPVELRIGNP